MKRTPILVLIALCGFGQVSYSAALAQAPMEEGGGSEKLTEYFKNFSGYIGYDVEKQPEQVKSDLLKAEQTSTTDKSFIESYLMSLLGMQPPQLLGTQAGGLNFPEQMISQTFIDYNNEDAGGGQISFSKLFDNEPRQKDPISQAVLDILSTPNFSSCFSSDPNATEGLSEKDCFKLLTRERVMGNEIGMPIPLAKDVYDPEANQKWVQVLNSNNLLSPLMYNDQDLAGLVTQGNAKEGITPGLIGKSQAEIAANFVQFVSGIVLPVDVPSKTQYDALFRQMGTGSIENQMRARGALFEYINKLRVYSAQVSVGLSNLYYIVSKRMPKTLSGNAKQKTSQALNEFKMATWRLNTPATTEGGPDTSWVSQINTASPATVQKEIAVLLAEMNYQLYLNRQQQERILLTESILLFQGSKSIAPAPVLGAPGSEAPPQPTPPQGP